MFAFFVEFKFKLECEFRISGHTQKSEDFQTIQEKPTTCNISTDALKQWSPTCGPCGYLLWLPIKNRSN